MKMPVVDQPSVTDSTIGTLEYHIRQGFEEADAFNEIETVCQMKMLMIEDSFRNGDDVDEIISSLKVAAE